MTMGNDNQLRCWCGHHGARHSWDDDNVARGTERTDVTHVSVLALLEFRQVALGPAENRCVRKPDASIRHHDHQVSQTQFETRVPANTQDDDVSVEMSSLEQCFDRNEPLHSVIIIGRGCLHQNPFYLLSEGWRIEKMQTIIGKLRHRVTESQIGSQRFHPHADHCETAPPRRRSRAVSSKPTLWES
jgi:hypothetical protein